jgi:predicted dehydrogenase
MTISAAIVGAGRTGGWHARDLARIEGVRLVGVADVRREAAEALVGESGAAVSVDYRELLERTRPDVVYFCTPAHGHLEQMTFAAERGINIFVEKPLAATMADAKAAVAAVERHGVLCTVGYHWRYNPATDAARAALGDAAVALLAGWWYWTIPPVAWIREARWGGGQIFDQATHLIDLMRLFAGDVSHVSAAYTRNAIPEAELPNWDASAVTLRFAGGAVGSVHCTYALFPGIPNSNGVDVAARELLLRVNLGQTTIFRRDREPEVVTAPEGWSIDQPFIAALRRNDPGAIRATAREGMLSVAVSLAANYAAVTGKVVALDDFVANPPGDAVIVPNEEVVFTGAAT